MNNKDARTQRKTFMNQIIIPPEVERLATMSVDAAFAVHTELGPA
jgi:hypothetical protein